MVINDHEFVYEFVWLVGPIFWYHCHCLLTQETKIAEHNMIWATDRVEATLFIVQDVDELPERVKWAASLTGGWVAESSCFLRGQGMLLKYQKAIRTNYKLLLTDDFRERHPEMTDLISRSIQIYKPKNGWRIVEEIAKAHLVLCTAQNLVTPDGGQKVFQKACFLSHISKLDMDKCGRVVKG